MATVSPLVKVIMISLAVGPAETSAFRPVVREGAVLGAVLPACSCFSGCRPRRDFAFRPVVREGAVLGAVLPACSCLAPSAQAEAFLA